MSADVGPNLMAGEAGQTSIGDPILARARGARCVTLTFAALAVRVWGRGALGMAGKGAADSVPGEVLGGRPAWIAFAPVAGTQALARRAWVRAAGSSRTCEALGVDRRAALKHGDPAETEGEARRTPANVARSSVDGQAVQMRRSVVA